MIQKQSKRITARQVAELPAGTVVTIHGVDRHGKRVWQSGALTLINDQAVLLVDDAWGTMKIPVREYKGRWWTVGGGW